MLVGSNSSRDFNRGHLEFNGQVLHDFTPGLIYKIEANYTHDLVCCNNFIWLMLGI